MLQEHGNVVSDEHATALRHLLWLMTAQAFGHIEGRFVAPHPTGSGKTTAILAWLVELAQSWEIPVCVSMFTVEALCRLYRDLLRAGLTEGQVGLIHSYDVFDGPLAPGELPPPGKASEPSLPWDSEKKRYPYRQVVLVSHNRLRKADLSRFFHVGDQPRALTIFDESLVTNDSRTIDADALLAAYSAMANSKAQTELKPLTDYLTTFAEWYSSVDPGGPPAVYAFPELSPDAARMLNRLADGFDSRVTKSKAQREAVRTAVADRGLPFRLIRAGSSRLVRPERTFPDEIENVLILDASYYRKVAEQFDATIEGAEQALSTAHGRSVDLFGFKQYDNVVVKRLKIPSGRTSVEADLQGHQAKLAEVLAVVRSIPADEAVLVFSFRDLGGLKGSEFVERKLREAGVDLDAHVEVDGVARRRVNLLTWGQETGINDFAFCRHVVLYGILRRDRVDLAALYLGARNDLSARYGLDQLRAHDEAEAAQAAFQALSRGSCRIMSDGQARTMTGYVMTDSDTIGAWLADLMPGVRFKPWEPTVPHRQTERERLIDQLRTEISAHFAEQARLGQAPSISSRSLRRAVDPDRKIAKQTWSNSVDEALKGRFWCRDRSSIVAFDPPVVLNQSESPLL